MLVYRNKSKRKLNPCNQFEENQMRKNFIIIATTSLALAASIAFAQVDQTLTGTVSDAMCGKKHMMQGATAAKCTRVCVNGGSYFALVVGDKVYVLKGAKPAIDKFAGEKVAVTGTLTGATITVASIKSVP
jgi:hypothetical protein